MLDVRNMLDMLLRLHFVKAFFFFSLNNDFGFARQAIKLAGLKLQFLSLLQWAVTYISAKLTRIWVNFMSRFCGSFSRPGFSSSKFQAAVSRECVLWYRTSVRQQLSSSWAAGRFGRASPRQKAAFTNHLGAVCL